jgi:isopenicillin N synthase-like dioxygenase
VDNVLRHSFINLLPSFLFFKRNYPHPEVPPLPGQLRASAHTDYGSLTILRQDNAPGGLQVLNKDGSWQDVKTGDQDVFIINLGDLMARWTNDQWVSTIHRVINPPPDAKGSTRRQSMAFFHNLNADALVETIPTCITPENPLKYEPVRALEYILQKHSKANY